ncbi:hypothetical protein SAMN05421790_12116 [Kroppenstedtia eburnea]|uniref:Uncharacterized protein n=1 Tax=Kroppenstedtia eburnea TaxID=714067 RepID=A0A1N7Q8W9_9BACL|nr:hypothetical protein SAMN05421790_12116 [Kroppenstedtia eburnea]
MKQNTLLFDLLQSLYSCDEWAELARVFECNLFVSNAET